MTQNASWRGEATEGISRFIYLISPQLAQALADRAGRNPLRIGQIIAEYALPLAAQVVTTTNRVQIPQQIVVAISRYT